MAHVLVLVGGEADEVAVKENNLKFEIVLSSFQNRSSFFFTFLFGEA